MLKRIFYIILFLSLIHLNYAENYNCDSCSNCTNIIQNVASFGDNIYLVQNINSNGTCIDWGNNNNDITLNCQNNIINGNLSGTGIYTITSNNIIIQNCIVNNFSSGIYSYGSNQSIFNNKIFNSSNYGIQSNTLNGLIYSNEILNCKNGIYITNINTSIYSNIISNSTSYGIDARWYYHNIFENTITNSNRGIGIFGGSHNNTIKNNNIYNNNIGLYIGWNNTNNNLFLENKVENNLITIQFAEYNGYPKNNTFIKNHLGNSSKIEISVGTPANFASNNFSANYYTDFNNILPFCILSGEICDSLATLPLITQRNSTTIFPSGNLILAIILIFLFFLF